LLEELRQAGRLSNAIVILYSDHGEGLGLAADRLKATDEQAHDYNSYAHGGYALADSQFRVVLAMQRWESGRPLWTPRSVGGPASLIDIAPTLVEEIDLPATPDTFDGQSLHDVLVGNMQSLPPRFRFVESGLTGASVDGPEIDERAAAKEFGQLYVVTGDARFEVDPRRLQERLALKQRGVISGQLGLATKPRLGSDRSNQDCWILADYTTRSIRCLSNPGEVEAAAPLYEAACTHFGGDPGFESRWCAGEGR
jgi:hypothetical protein